MNPFFGKGFVEFPGSPVSALASGFLLHLPAESARALSVQSVAISPDCEAGFVKGPRWRRGSAVPRRAGEPEVAEGVSGASASGRAEEEEGISGAPVGGRARADPALGWGFRGKAPYALTCFAF